MAKLNPKKMKVAELKTELEARDIQVAKGLKKADLIALLSSALENENGNIEDDELLEEDADASTVNESDVNTEDDSALLGEEDAPVAEEKPAESQDETPIEEPSAPEEEQDMASAGDASPFEVISPSEVQDIPEPEEKMLVEDAPETVESNGAEQEQMESQDYEEETEKKEAEEEMDVKPDEPDTNDVPVDEQKADAEKPESQSGSQSGDDESKKDSRGEDSDRKRSSSDRRDRSDGHRHDHGSRKRHHDDHDRHHRRYEDRYAPPPEEPEEEFDDALVVLDKYNSDLNLKLHRDRLTAQPLTLEGFAYLWAGARATYGHKAGKICYECKLSEEHSVRHVPSSEPNRHLVRLGWSRNLSSRMLGESELSFAYCGTGKKVTDKTVEDYAETFKRGDVIGSYIDWSGDESVTISYTKNGQSLGVAFTVEKEKLGDDALFPHVMSKNTTIELNFGQKETPFFPHPEDFPDYVFPASVALEERVRGTIGATTRKECQVLMMCGLPGSGKTYFVENYVREHPDKNFSVLGAHFLMARMKASGLECKANRETLLQHATNCLNRLFQVACRKKRNFILDQTNVYASAQRRRMRTFEGYQRKALVIVPKDEDFKERVEKRIKEHGKDIPDFAVNEMKANFTFPEVGDLFEEVEFLELDKEEASKVTEEYRTEAKKKGPPPEKRFRSGFDLGRGSSVGRGGGNWSGVMGGRPPFRGGMGSNFGSGSFGGAGRLASQRQGGYRDGGRGDNRRSSGSGGTWNKGSQGDRNWNQNRSTGGASRGASAAGSQVYGANRGGYGGNRTGAFNKSGGTGGNRTSSQGNRTNSNQNRTQQRGMNNQRNSQQSNFNYHQAYQQQAAQFSTQTTGNQTSSYQQQSYNQQSQQPDYSQQWAQYYQQQAAAQQQQQAAAAAAAAQYQNYYAYQNAYSNTNTSSGKANQ